MSYSSTGYQRWFLLTLHAAIIWNSYNDNAVPCIARGFLPQTWAFSHSLCNHTEDSSWTRFFQLNMKHHSKLPHKTKGGAGTKLCYQIEFAQKSPKGAAVIWHTPGLIRHYLSSKGSASVMSCWCQFPANKRVKKHAANSPVSMKMEPWPKSSFVWVVRYFR